MDGERTPLAVARLGEHMRLEPVMRGTGESYVYEHEVEEFLRWSPHVRRHSPGGREPGPEPLHG